MKRELKGSCVVRGYPLSFSKRKHGETAQLLVSCTYRGLVARSKATQGLPAMTYRWIRITCFVGNEVGSHLTIHSCSKALPKLRSWISSLSEGDRRAHAAGQVGVAPR